MDHSHAFSHAFFSRAYATPHHHHPSPITHLPLCPTRAVRFALLGAACLSHADQHACDLMPRPIRVFRPPGLTTPTLRRMMTPRVLVTTSTSGASALTSDAAESLFSSGFYTVAGHLTQSLPYPVPCQVLLQCCITGVVLTVVDYLSSTVVLYCWSSSVPTVSADVYGTTVSAAVTIYRILQYGSG